jgi:hypothetical protein
VTFSPRFSAFVQRGTSHLIWGNLVRDSLSAATPEGGKTIWASAPRVPDSFPSGRHVTDPGFALNMRNHSYDRRNAHSSDVGKLLDICDMKLFDLSGPCVDVRPVHHSMAGPIVTDVPVFA